MCVIHVFFSAMYCNVCNKKKCVSIDLLFIMGTLIHAYSQVIRSCREGDIATLQGLFDQHHKNTALFHFIGEWPLRMAVEHQQVHVVQYLFHTAPPFYIAAKNNAVLRFATQQDHPELLQLLLEHAEHYAQPLRLVEPWYETLLFTAIASNSLRCLSMLQAAAIRVHGCGLNTTARGGFAVRYALQQGSMEALAWILYHAPLKYVMASLALVVPRAFLLRHDLTLAVIVRRLQTWQRAISDTPAASFTLVSHRPLHYLSVAADCIQKLVLRFSGPFQPVPCFATDLALCRHQEMLLPSQPQTEDQNPKRSLRTLMDVNL